MRNKIACFVLCSIALALCFLPAEAQQPKKVPRIGLLVPFSASSDSTRRETHSCRDCAIWAMLMEKTFAIEYRYAEGELDRLPDLAAELVRLNVDVIVTRRY